MSPLWRDRIQIVLCPSRVIFVRLGRGLNLRVVDKLILPGADSPAAGAPAWQPALDALRLGLAEKQWRNAEARVVLSNHFAHYLMVDWDVKLTGAEEQLAMVRYSFAQTYGETAEDWDFRWNEGRPPAPCLACGVDRGLLDGLREVISTVGQGLPLIGVQPYLMAAFNHWRRNLDGERDWFLLSEAGRLCLAWFKAEEWAGVHSQQAGADWGRELPRILERTLLLTGLTGVPARLCIHAPETPEMGIVLAEGWSGSLLRLQACPGFVPANDAAYAMAMNI